MLENFLKKLTSDFFQQDTISHVGEIPYYLSAKDKQGKYIYCNHFKAKDLGFEKNTDLLGMTDFDIWSHHYALQLRNNDKKALAAHRILTVFEQAENPEKNLRIFGVSCKGLLISLSKKIIGTTCLSLILKKEPLSVGSPFHFVDESDENKLSLRQKECLYFLAKGMTIKQIAQQLNLSPKTVENYLENIKNKLGCHSRSDLIEKALQFSYIKFKLLFS